MDDRLTMDQALVMLDSMASEASRDCDEADQAGNENLSAYWDGWADGLRTLQQHIETGVKASCFPIGSCTCHPVQIPGRPTGS